jgi:hypothetical protein
MNESIEKSRKNLTGPEQRWNNEGGHQPMGEEQGAGEPPALETVISQTITYPDGSQIRIEIDAPAGVSGDLASADYYDYLFPQLEKIDPAIKRGRLDTKPFDEPGE